MKNKPIQSFLKPRKGRYIKQGYYKCRKPEKYVGDPTQIIYRSSWELAFLKYCDLNDIVIKYGSEPIAIKYISPFDKRQHNYFVDFYMETLGINGTIQRWLVEIKPGKHTKKPKKPKHETFKSMKNYGGGIKRFLMNLAKFKAARQYANRLSFKFLVMEYDKSKKIFKIIDWEKNEHI